MKASELNVYLDKFILSPTFLKKWKQPLENKLKSGKWTLCSSYPETPLTANEKIAIYNSDKTLSQLAIIFGLSRERARQIKFKALMKVLYMKLANEEGFNQEAWK